MGIKQFDIVEIRVRGESSGQAIDNILFYKAINTFAGEHPLSDFLNEFIDNWQDNICPLLTSDYSVLDYRARICGGIIWRGAADTPPTDTKPAMRYREAVAIDGGVSDVGVDDPPSHPTQTAVSVRKVCGIPKTWAVDVDPDAAPVVTTLEKAVDGGIRLAPIAEDLSEAADQNRWTAAFVTLVGTAMETIREIDPGVPANVLRMCVPSFFKEGRQRVLPVSGLPTMLIAEVTSFSVNPYVSSQNTRKQRRAG